MSPSTSGTQALRTLQSILNSSVENILSICSDSEVDFPSLGTPIDGSELIPGLAAERTRTDPRVQLETARAIAVSSQVSLGCAALAFNLPAALGAAESLNVAEIIRSSGPRGMPANEIASVSGTDSKKLFRIFIAHVLRFLATQPWFREVAPDIYANNLLSSLIDSGKEGFRDPDFAKKKHIGTSGLAALVGFNTDENFKATSHLATLLTDPRIARSDEPAETGFQLGVQTPHTIWEYYDSGESELAPYRSERFNVYMKGLNGIQPPSEILEAYEWEEIAEGGLLVDVGGGLGHVALEVARKHSDVRVVVEDRGALAEETTLYWQANSPSHVTSGKYYFAAVDFFEEQPALPRAVSVFLLRLIIHNWSDKYALQTLRRLRAAAAPESKLVLIGCLTDFACPRDSTRDDGNEAGDSASEQFGAPYPLLANMGRCKHLPSLARYSNDKFVEQLRAYGAGPKRVTREERLEAHRSAEEEPAPESHRLSSVGGQAG